jgi:hypothetical protein
MELIDAGVLLPADAGGTRATLTFPTLTALRDGTMLVTVRAGSGKDSADERVELWRSSDFGRTWSGPAPFPEPPPIAGATGSLKLCYLTEIPPGALLAAAMWVDRSTYPGAPLFNPTTEGCLPMAILLAASADGGVRWSPWRHVPLPENLGPPSLTSPLLPLADGALALSIETNKAYHDASPWLQQAVLLHSCDGGLSWIGPTDAARDPSGRIFNWDLRFGVAPDGRIGSFAWTYDSVERVYRQIHRRISADGGRSWSAAEALGFADQAGRPAVLHDGRIVLPWVDRFGSRSIKARLATSIAGPFGGESMIYTLDATGSARATTTGDLLAEMAVWTFGLPYAEVVGDEVWILYYAGTEVLDVRYARLRV